MKKIKMLLFAAIMLGMVVNGYCQDEEINCKSVKEKKDDFSGEMTKSKIVNLNLGYLQFKKVGEKYFIEYQIIYRAEKNAPLKTGEELLLKLESGDVLTIKATKDIAPTTKVAGTSSGGYGVSTTFVAEYGCTYEDYDKLSKSMPTNLKAMVANEPFLYKINKLEGASIKKAAYCISH